MSDLNNISRFDTHCHSEYSNIRLLDSINKLPDIIKTAHKLGMKGIALTDHECLCGHFKWLAAERKLKKDGVIPEDFKCACGNEIYLVDDRNNIERYWHYILIAKNATGHRALRELSSTAWYYSFSSKGLTRVPTEKKELEDILKKYPKSLIATSACLGGFLGTRVTKLVELENKKNNQEEIYKCNQEEIYKCKEDIHNFLTWNKELFGEDFYIEIATGTSKDQIKFNQRISNIAKAYDIKIVIGSDAHYLTEKERPIHKAYLNSKEGEREVDEFYWDAHMMDNDEAWGNLEKASVYSEEDFCDMCNASMEIYDKIENFSLERKPILPVVTVNPKVSLVAKELLVEEKYPTLNYLFNSTNPQEKYWLVECLNALINKNILTPVFLERLETEAFVIKTIGEKVNECLYKYFNTFQYFIDLFWRCGSIVGPGRGSAVCFLSNYLLGITQLNPVDWKLKYWRLI